MNNIFKLKLIVAIGIVLAATFSASADTYTEADAAKRTYLVPSDGKLKGKKLLNVKSSHNGISPLKGLPATGA